MFHIDPSHGLYSISRKNYNKNEENISTCLDFLKYISLDHFGNDNRNFAALLINGHGDKIICDKIDQKIVSGLKSKDFSKSLNPENIEIFIETILSKFEKSFLENMVELSKKRANIIKHMSMSENQTSSQLRELNDMENQLNSGVTIAIVIVIQGNMFISNIGDNQIILVSKDNDSEDDYDHNFILLTEEQSFNNEKEIQRIKENCGLDADALRWLSILSTERCHSRCIGDYELKCNYNKFNDLNVAKSSPLISTPQPTKCIPLEENFTHILLISSGLYYLVRDLIYDRDKVVGEITRKFFEIKCSFPELSLENLCKSVLESFVSDHRQCYDQYQNLTTDDSSFSEYSHHDDLSIFAIELGIFKDEAHVIVDAENGFSLVDSISTNVSTAVDSLDGRDSNNMKDQFSSLKTSNNTCVMAVTAYVNFKDWTDAINKCSAEDLAFIDSIVDTIEGYEDTICEEIESVSVTRLTTLEDTSNISSQGHSNLIKGFNH